MYIAMATHFGEHITIDGYGGNPKHLDDEQAVLSALRELCDHLGMHALTEPLVIRAPEGHTKDPGGWTGFLIIAESHISIHTFPRRRFLTADVYSCQNGIDRAAIIEFFKTTFELEEIETHFLERGLQYPEYNLL